MHYLCYSLSWHWILVTSGVVVKADSDFDIKWQKLKEAQHRWEQRTWCYWAPIVSQIRTRYIMSQWSTLIGTLIHIHLWLSDQSQNRTSRTQSSSSYEELYWRPIYRIDSFRLFPRWQSVTSVRESDANNQERGWSRSETKQRAASPPPLPTCCLIPWSDRAWCCWEQRSVWHVAHDPIRGDVLLSSCTWIRPHCV